MTKNEFMSRLSAALGALPGPERDDILADFEEHFATALSGGKPEEEVTRDLGDPAEIAAQYTSEAPPPEADPVGTRVGRGLLAGMGLLLFDLILGLPIFATVFALWLALWAVVLSLFATGLGLLLSPIALLWYRPIPWGAAMLFGLSLLGLTGLLTMGMYYVSKYLFRGTAAYIRSHISIIKGGRLS